MLTRSIIHKNVHDLFFDGEIISLPVEPRHWNLVCRKDNIYNWCGKYDIKINTDSTDCIQLIGSNKQVKAAKFEIQRFIRDHYVTKTTRFGRNWKWCQYFEQNILSELRKKNSLVTIKIDQKLKRIYLRGPSQAVDSVKQQVVFIFDLMRHKERVNTCMNLIGLGYECQIKKKYRCRKSKRYSRNKIGIEDIRIKRKYWDGLNRMNHWIRSKISYIPIKYELKIKQKVITVEGTRHGINWFKHRLFVISKIRYKTNIFIFKKSEDWKLLAQKRNRKKEKITYRFYSTNFTSNVRLVPSKTESKFKTCSLNLNQYSQLLLRYLRN